MSRKTATKVSENIATKSANFTHGDLLKRALTWVINDSMFCHITLHGNIKWKARQLVIVAVLWVWRSYGCGGLVGVVWTHNARTVVCSCSTSVAGYVWLRGGHDLSGSYGGIEHVVAEVTASRSEAIAQTDGTGWWGRTRASRFVGGVGG